MITLNHGVRLRCLSVRGFVFVALVSSVALFGQFVHGQEIVYCSPQPANQTKSDEPWWRSIWYHSDGSLKHKNRLTTSICSRQYRLPVHPPVCAPGFGYHQTYWSQLPIGTQWSESQNVSPQPQLTLGHSMDKSKQAFESPQLRQVFQLYDEGIPPSPNVFTDSYKPPLLRESNAVPELLTAPSDPAIDSTNSKTQITGQFATQFRPTTVRH